MGFLGTRKEFRVPGVGNCGRQAFGSRRMSPNVKRLALALVSLMGCSAGGAAERVRPDDPTYAQAMDVELEFGERPTVLVVDWEAETRVDLEVAMKRGVAVMALDAHGPHLLDCSMAGDYTFMGTTRKERVVRLLNGSEVAANLPLHGAGLAATLEGEFSRGATLDVALSMVGKTTTAARRARRSQLRGECDGATHIVRSATLGAFAMSTGTQATIRTAAELFEYGAKAGSESAREIHNTDGDLEACKTSSPNADAPPDRCGAPLRLELAPVVGDADAAPSADPPGHAQSCPSGTQLQDEKCITVSPDSPQRCDWKKDPKQCADGCERGHANSCFSLGWAYDLGVGVAIDRVKARAIYERACELDDRDGCRAVAFFQANGIGGASDVPTAMRFYKQACVDGDAAACSDLGAMYSAGLGVPKDFELAIGLYRRACSGAHPRGCINLGQAYLAGDGVPRDEGAAKALFERACTADHPDGCRQLATLTHATDPAGSLALLEKACGYSSGTAACVDAGVRYNSGSGAPTDETRATALFSRACELNNARGCANLGLQLLEGRGAPKDQIKAAELFQRTCAESRMGCDTLGEMYAKGLGVEKDRTTARGVLEEACSAGDKRSCAMKRKLKL